MPFSLRSRVAKSSKVPESIAAFSKSHGGGELEKGRFNTGYFGCEAIETEG